MRILLSIAALAAMAATPASAEPRAHTGFNSISASAGTRVEVSVGPTFSVDVSGPNADRIVTRVDDGTLIVRTESGWSWRGVGRALVRVTMPVIEGLEASSGANVEARGVNTPSIGLEASSGGRLNVAGTCGDFDADASSGAVLNASSLRCNTGSVEASSGANVLVHASETLNVEASSGGRVIAHGQPDFRVIALSSGGTLRRAN